MKTTRKNLVVCGVGGSGTRAVVRLLQELDPREQLDDRNEADDTSAATFLFKHRDVLEAEGRFGFDACWRDLQMALDRQGASANFGTTLRLFRLALKRRPPYPQAWFFQRAWRLRHEMSVRSDGKAATWLVKEPNLHICAEPILCSRPDVDVVVIARSGLDMAFSKNQQQLANWGDGGTGPTASLAYWCAVHDRLFLAAEAFPGRVHFLGLEQLCCHPEDGVRPLQRILPAVDPSVITEAVGRVFMLPDSVGRYKQEAADDLPVQLVSKAKAIMDRIESGSVV